MYESQDWGKWKNAIHSLYILEKRPLQGSGGVMESMETKHGFQASKGQYERHLKEWGFMRKTTKETWQVISRKVEKRKREGEASAVYMDGMLVPSKKLHKEISRQGHMTMAEQLKWAQAPSPNTPKGFQVLTPPSIPVHRLLFKELPIFQVQDTLKNLIQFHPSLDQSPDASPAGLISFIGKALDPNGVNPVRPMIDSYLPTAAFKAEFHGPDFAIERAERMSLAQAINLFGFMVSNNLSPISSGGGIYRWLEEEGITPLAIFQILKGPSADALLENLFRLAVEDQNLQMVKELLKGGANPNASTCRVRGDPLLLTPLQFASVMGNIPLVETLIKAGSQINHPDSGWTGNILALAIYGWGCLEFWSDQSRPIDSELLPLVKILIGAHAEVNSSDNISRHTSTKVDDLQQRFSPGSLFYPLLAETHSPLTMAAKFQAARVVDYLIENGADVLFRVNGLHSALRESFFAFEVMSTILRNRDMNHARGDAEELINLMRDEDPVYLLDDEDMMDILGNFLDAGVELNDHLPCTHEKCPHEYFECFSILDVVIPQGSMQLIDYVISMGAKTTRHTLELAFECRVFQLFGPLLQMDAPPPVWASSRADDVLVGSTSPLTKKERQKNRILILHAIIQQQPSDVQALCMQDDQLYLDNLCSWPVLEPTLDLGDFSQWRYLFDENVLRGALRSRALQHLLFDRESHKPEEAVNYLLEAGSRTIKIEISDAYSLVEECSLTLLRKLIYASSIPEAKMFSRHPNRHPKNPTTFLSIILVHAIGTGDDDLVEEVIRAGVDINHIGCYLERSSGCYSGILDCCPPLTMAIRKQNWALVDRLRRLKASVNPIDAADLRKKKHQTPLWAAASGGHWALAKSLIEDGAEVNDPAALEFIAKDYEILQLCVMKLLTDNYSNQTRDCLLLGLYEILRSSHLPKNAELIVQSGLVDVDKFHGSEKLLCSLIATSYEWREKKSILCLMLEGGANLNSVVRQFSKDHVILRETALEVAVDAGDLQFLRTLLEYGASVDMELEEGILFSPIQRAARNGSEEIVSVLLDAGSEPNAVSPWGQNLYKDTKDGMINVWDTDLSNMCYGRIGTAIQEATKRHLLEMVQTLLKRGANPDGITLRCPHTALQIACRDGQKDVAELLIEYGADVNASPAEVYGATPLQFAAIGGYLGIAHYLLEKGADVNARPAEFGGRTALEGAAEHGRIDMVQLLKNAGADISEEGGQGQWERAMLRATENGHLATRNLLKSYLF
ncbi:ankyrin repeat-containing domain protein [Camillea tinctor]|nr:ankyrin repeat-containing domain protein [Camillea tinctor]